jgi:hypothetical protein
MRSGAHQWFCDAVRDGAGVARAVVTAGGGKPNFFY